MKIPSHLWKSPHGTFYFRVTSKSNGKQVSKKVSLQTKDPTQAKTSAIKLLACLAESDNSMSKIKKFEIQVVNGGLSFKTDPNIPDDVVKLGQFLKDNTEQLKALIPQNNNIIQSAPSHHTGFTAQFSDVVNRYEIRKKKELSEKTVYQYLQSIKKFMLWAESRDGYNPLLMSHIDKRFITLYIEYLQANNYNNNRITENHLKPLNTFFAFAISIGEYPDIAIPSKNHHLATDKQTLIKKDNRETFKIDDLEKIFNAENYSKIKHPDVFWLPILGLFTGARMNELCTLATIDIKEHKEDGFYSISINNEIGTLKNQASKRVIPLHNKIIEIGFLDYIQDVKKFGSVMLFPNLQPDTFGSFIKEPSRRFGKYLDDIGINEKTKVFHSFRSTLITHLRNKDDVKKENRLAFTGHEIDDTQNKHYIEFVEPSILYNNVVNHITLQNEFTFNLKYNKGQFNQFFAKRMKELKSRALKSKE